MTLNFWLKPKVSPRPLFIEKTEVVVLDIFSFSAVLSYLIEESREETPFLRSFFTPDSVVGNVNSVCSTEIINYSNLTIIVIEQKGNLSVAKDFAYAMLYPFD